jgi:propionyl-CoA synthetase
VDDNGNEVPRGQMGNIVLALPLAPTAFRTLWEDEERFYRGYLKRFGGRWVDTGDAGWIDEQGYVHIMARSGQFLSLSSSSSSTSAVSPYLGTVVLLVN